MHSNREVITVVEFRIKPRIGILATRDKDLKRYGTVTYEICTGMMIH